MNARTSTRTSALAVLVAAGLALAACATPSGDSIPGSGSGTGVPTPAPPAGEVIAQGTVMETGGDMQLCLGAIMESYPPRCHGIPLQGWSWDGVEGSEESGAVRWGAYALQGTYDGTAFTVTQPPIMLALYDPLPFPDPTDGATGSGDEGTLLQIQDALPTRLGSDGGLYLASGPERGYLWVDVVWDDGSIQQRLDDEYGSGIVVVRSAIREVG